MQHACACGRPQERGGQEADGRGTTSSQTSPGESGLGTLDLGIHTTGAHVLAGVLLSLHPQGEDTARSCVIGGWRRKGGPGRVRTRQSRDGGGRPGCTGPASAWAPEPPLGSPRLSWPRCCGGPRGAAGRLRKANEKQSFGPEKHTHSPLTSFQARKVKQGCD